MQQPQQRIERVRQHPLRHRPAGGLLQPRLDHLEIKAAKLVPGELVQQPRRVGKMISRRAPRSLRSVTVAKRLRIQRSSVTSSAPSTGPACTLPGSSARIARRSTACCRSCRASSNRSLTTAPRGSATSAGLLGPLGCERLAALFAFDARLHAILFRLLDQRAGNADTRTRPASARPASRSSCRPGRTAARRRRISRSCPADRRRSLSTSTSSRQSRRESWGG